MTPGESFYVTALCFITAGASSVTFGWLSVAVFFGLFTIAQLADFIIIELRKRS